MEFKPGDVVIYGRHPTDKGEALIKRVDGRGLWLTAWRAVGEDRWIIMSGLLSSNDTDVKPHPEPDRIWADFTVWRLTGAADPD